MALPALSERDTPYTWQGADPGAENIHWAGSMSTVQMLSLLVQHVVILPVAWQEL